MTTAGKKAGKLSLSGLASLLTPYSSRAFSPTIPAFIGHYPLTLLGDRQRLEELLHRGLVRKIRWDPDVRDADGQDGLHQVHHAEFEELADPFG